MLPSPLIALHFKRMYGFAASLAAGLLLMFLVMINFTYPVPYHELNWNDPVANLTVFLMGPEQQINMMFVSTLPLSMSDASFLHSFCALLVTSFSPSLSYNVYYPKLDLTLVKSARSATLLFPQIFLSLKLHHFLSHVDPQQDFDSDCDPMQDLCTYVVQPQLYSIYAKNGL
ncbi:hypothetical protein IGI04_001533 [Brassica rapa subsp. trilocularis]|uniref:Uncharacterized protein n=1 Tax=Brassica rapa subsp. trilocularis TaxID=1813537 RepID=A0ABQ7NTS5_BRACM|nr:hypothetical protein IGI04_001533 [Brassica rapa subsp. trilocularis]